MKNKLLLLLIIINIILILLLLHFNSNTEHFDYYKSNTIQLTLQSHKPLTISTGNENTNYSILANIILLFSSWIVSTTGIFLFRIDPEAKILCEHFLLDKRIAQLATGTQAWLKHE